MIEYEEIRKSKELFDSCKQWLARHVLQWMEKRKKEEEEAVKETMKSLGDCIHAQVFETVPHTIGGEYSVVFSDALHLAFTHSALPLGLFSNVNLREIFMKNHNVPTCTFIPTSATTKLGVTSKKVTILDIAKICAELSVSEEELEGMDLEKFHECTFNFTQLCREVDNKNGGNPFFSEFTTNHFQFFLGKHDCSELFQYWKPQEKELHDQFFIDQHPYQVAYWEEVYRSCQLFKLSADNIKVEIDKLRQEKLIGENGAGGKKKSDIAGSRASQAYQPFPKSNKESKPTLAPCCILCGEHGHRCNECPNAKKAIWAIYCNGEVTHPDTNKPVCVLFNIFHKKQLSCIDKSGKSATGKCGKLHAGFTLTDITNTALSLVKKWNWSFEEATVLKKDIKLYYHCKEQFTGGTGRAKEWWERLPINTKSHPLKALAIVIYSIVPYAAKIE
uniref:CCHC-type domain-containing protein n=1 Tax=Moniliophthora roreri TaxID=221103 RepID=A0A0W0G5V8_MONRR